MSCHENMCSVFREPESRWCKLAMIFIAIKGTQVFTSDALLILTIQNSSHCRVKVPGLDR